MKIANSKTWIIMLCGMLLPCVAFAQIAAWHVHPQYDDIHILEKSIITGKKDGKTFFWKAIGGEGQEILSTEKKLEVFPFKDDCVVLLEKDTPNLYGFLTRDGSFVSLEGQGYVIANNYPYFEDGCLYVSKKQYFAKDKEYAFVGYFLNRKGEPVYGPFASAQPFSHGYAVVQRFKNMDKSVKDVFYDYCSINPSMKILPDTNLEEIAFASSVDDNGEAIIVVDKKVYRCKLAANEWKQIYTENVEGKTDKEKKKLMVVTPNSRVDLREQGKEFCLDVKQGELAFDRFMHLRSIRYNGQDVEAYPEETPYAYDPVSVLGRTPEKDGLYGLTYKEDILMPEQFERVVACDDDMAVVKFQGHQGVLRVDPKGRFEILVDEGKGNLEGISFKHRTQDAKLEVFFPRYIDPEVAKLVVNDENRLCTIKKGRRNCIKNEETNGLQYDCTFSIPQDDLPSSETLCIPYRYQIVYECQNDPNDGTGLLSKVYEVCINEWYVNLFDIEITEPNFDIDIKQDKIRINILLTRQEEDYSTHRQVYVSYGEGVMQDCNQVSSTKYYFDMPIGDQKLLNFDIHVDEEGCPQNIFPCAISVAFQENEAGEPEGQTKTVTITQTKKQSRRHLTPRPSPTPQPVKPINWDVDLVN